jgi:DNA ligase 1
MPSLTKLSYLSNNNNQQGLLLAEKWEMTNDPTGYWISEKLEGIRAFWNGRSLLSRQGNVFAAPDWFTDVLPTDTSLDGELYAGRGKFQDVVSIVRSPDSQLWSNRISYHIFDIVDRTGTIPFEERISRLQRLFPRKVDWIVLVDHEKCRSKEHLQRKLDEVTRIGGEGLMLREPKSVYVPMRSRTLYKVKTIADAEAVVVGYEPGIGRNEEVYGALKCRMQSGKEFKTGTRMSDTVLQDPPKIVASRHRGIISDGRVRL